MRAGDEHDQQYQIRRDATEAAAQHLIEITGSQALQDANRDRRNDRADDAVYPAQDDDGKYLQPDQDGAKTAAGDPSPQDTGDHGNDAGQAPDDHQVATNIDAHRHGNLRVVGDRPQGETDAAEAVERSD